MSLLTSLFTGASGMTAHGNAIGVVGDNIANVSTTGFKRTRAGFADVLGGNLGSQRLGAGVRSGVLQTQFEQGSVQQTGGMLDMAVRGDGYFVVSGNHNGQAANYYSRDGRFALDQSGYVVNPGGLRLQGYLIDPAGVRATAPSDLQLAGLSAPPVATTSAAMSVHLDSGAAAVPAATAFDPTDRNTFSYQTQATVYDSLGAAHDVQMFFRNNGGGAWEWHAMVDGGEVTGGTPGTLTEIATGTLGFDGAGALDTEVQTVSAANFIGANGPQAITFDFGDAITTDGGTGRVGTTQTAGEPSVIGLDIDGRATGALVDLTIADDGTITGVFDNGDTRELAQVALATFAADSGLTRAGDGLYAESSTSGQPLVDVAGSGGRGAISGGALEASNVDLSEELVTLIAYQRAFSANTRTVTTADEMLAEVANIKR
ncbi:MAG: flagellar hook protein FlgE [Kofleriaceae bacterium]|jgi:flagellar hook protein FlgE|nr:flagellar hook protein FlgE [Kofleriaceae bacterium]